MTNIKYVGRDGTEYTESTTAPTNAGKYTATITLSGVKTAEGENKSVAASVDYSIKYSVTFNTNGGSAVPQQLVEAGESATRPTDPTREGNNFGGWFADADFAKRYVFDEVTENTTVYAKWGEHRVTWTVGKFSIQDVFTGNAPAADSNTTVNLAAETLKPDDATLSWKTETDVSGDVTHTAQFSFPVTLNVNGGTINAGNVESYIYGTGATLPTDVTRAKYDFGGWFDNSGLTGTAVTQIGTTATGSKEYWAKWTEVYAVPATVTANSRTYDGTENPLVTVTGTATGGEMQYALGTATGAAEPYTTSVPSAVNAGTYYVWYRVKGDDDHNDAGPWKVAAAIKPAAVTLTANSGTETYDGTAKSVTGFRSSVAGLRFASTVRASGSGTNAGEYPVTFSGVTLNTTKDTTGNYVVTATADGKLTIKPVAVTLTANSRSTDVYDGTVKTVTGFTVSAPGLRFADTVSASGSGTDAGEYAVTFSGVTLNTTKDTTGNYVVTSTVNGKLTINPLQAAVVLAPQGMTLIYNGSAHELVTEGEAANGRHGRADRAYGGLEHLRPGKDRRGNLLCLVQGRGLEKLQRYAARMRHGSDLEQQLRGDLPRKRRHRCPGDPDQAVQQAADPVDPGADTRRQRRELCDDARPERRHARRARHPVLLQDDGLQLPELEHLPARPGRRACRRRGVYG